MFSEPFSNLSEAEVIALMFYWVATELAIEINVILRIRDESNQDVYEMWLTNTTRSIHITELLKCEQLNTQMLYYWPPDLTYKTLTWEKIQESMELASHINARQQSCMQSQYPGSYTVASNASYY